MSRVKDKIALVTGGSGGIGAATVRALHREGARVVAADVTAAAGEKLAAELGCTFCKLDVTREDDWKRAVPMSWRDMAHSTCSSTPPGSKATWCTARLSPRASPNGGG